jgi:hypothetical protein
LVEIQLGKRLGLPFPKTVVLPDQSTKDGTEGIVSQLSLEQVADELGLPCILKPFDGYAWEDVYVINSIEELSEKYHALYSHRILMAQQLVEFRDYFRVFCINKRDVLFIKWIPKPLSMGQYLHCDTELPANVKYMLNEMTINLNKVLDLDVNVVEWCRDGDGKWWIIDAFNEVPEVIPAALPSDYYAWIVDRFAECVLDKLNTNTKNEFPFHRTTE